MGDTATRESQAESPTLERCDGFSNPNAVHTAVTPYWVNEARKRHWSKTPLTRPRLLGSESPVSIPNRSPKKRRTITSSNWECNPAPPHPLPMEFDLGGFAFTHLPDPHQDYDRFNNDLVIEHYKPATRPYSGTQRKGIGEPPPNDNSYMEHIREALQAPFPLAEQTPLPGDLETALRSHRDNSRGTIREFLNPQLKTLRAIAQECRYGTNRWYKFTPDELKDTTGSIHIALLAHLTRFARMKGANWLMQFVVGFPTTGDYNKSGISPQKKRRDTRFYRRVHFTNPKPLALEQGPLERTLAHPKTFGKKR